MLASVVVIASSAAGAKGPNAAADERAAATRRDPFAELIDAARSLKSSIADRRITLSELDPANPADRRELELLSRASKEFCRAADRCLEAEANGKRIDWQALSDATGVDRSTLQSDLAFCIDVLAATTELGRQEDAERWRRVFWLSHALLTGPAADTLMTVHARLTGHVMRRLGEWACSPHRTADELRAVQEAMRRFRPASDRVERMLAFEGLSRERRLSEMIGALPPDSPERRRYSAIRDEVRIYYGALITLMEQKPRDRFVLMAEMENGVTLSDEALRFDPFIELSVYLLCTMEQLDTACEAHALLLAARAHHIETGGWPESVDDLHLGGWAPVDAASGLPLRLTRDRIGDADTVTVWAAGVDGQFDGVRSRSSRSAFSLRDGEGTDYAVTWRPGAAPGGDAEPCP